MKGPAHLSSSHLKLLCVCPSRSWSWSPRLCDALTYFDGHIDVFGVVHEVTESHEGFLPRQQVIRLQLLVQLGQGPAAIGDGSLGGVDVGGLVHRDPGVGHLSTPAEDDSPKFQNAALQKPLTKRTQNVVILTTVI